YELCFTISPQNYEKLLQKQLDDSISIIGTIQQQRGLTFEKDGIDHPFQFHGYQHFA
ncbi:MAG TPA: thiamine-phosphate kinase, partial [Acinetobacter radioresistens]|nr:thiamine-phosphate kinase [Acinetobacter radioresistens]